MTTKRCCKNCEYWEKPLDLLTSLKDDSFKFCKKSESEDGDAVVEGALMYAMDFEVYHAYALTSPEFLCSMFKDKGGSDD